MSIPSPAIVSSEDYLNLELPSTEKHEFFLGQIIGMTGGSLNHSQIQSNCIIELGNRFRSAGKKCGPYASDLRVKAHDLKYFYPDVTIICEKTIYDERSKSLMNPIGVIEILSESTASFDANEKAFAYQAIPSLMEYVLIDSQARRINIFKRNEKGIWENHQYAAQTHCRLFDFEIEMSEVYRNTEL